ncbi:GPI ethanolamine phosphate transferase 3 [Smittium culicis]|uniref:GPI ethanolamine phosphate transferase 3 n=1 Tax=Smittium culicis TaxID=133412 RepID=A0A1R1Y2H4_9FUNG|nr:GPI ethanolamine phosphate transferase 3 [Smittium culicis]OMJ24098.1 GPI ethanolamine phosphate transferase 3 [Smittium culicis]
MSLKNVVPLIYKFQFFIIYLFIAKIAFIGIYLFSSGFLLTRNELPNLSDSSKFPIGNHLDNLLFYSPSPKKYYTELSSPSSNSTSPKSIWPSQKYDKVVILIIDALRIDYATYNYSNSQNSFTYDSIPDLKPSDPFLKQGNSPNTLNFRNKLLSINSNLKNKPQQSQLLRFRADPPTTTLQRLKGLTTGQLPTFIDAGSNFAGSAIAEDNWLKQFAINYLKKPTTPPNILTESSLPQKNLVFLGDDTWSSLFPSELYHSANSSNQNKISNNSPWTFSRPFPSLDVWDLDTVDDGVISRLPLFLLPMINSKLPSLKSRNSSISDQFKNMSNHWLNLVAKNSSFSHPDFNPDPKNPFPINSEFKDWGLIIGHLLGVDHVGHRYGPVHNEMSRKLSQMDSLISLIIDSFDLDYKLQSESTPPPQNLNSSLLIVFGDHGMNMKGDHGGDSDEELDAAIFMYSNTPFKTLKSEARIHSVLQKTSDILLSLSKTNDIHTDSDISNGFSHNGHLYNGLPIRNMLQVDFVPTISLLLGLPIPFNNLGSINGELFCDSFYNVPNLNYSTISSLNSSISNNDHEFSKNILSLLQNNTLSNLIFNSDFSPVEWSYLYFMRLNAAQIYQYLSKYREFSSNHGFSKSMITNWNLLYTNAQNSYLKIINFRNKFSSASQMSAKDKIQYNLLEEIAAADYLTFTRVTLSDLRKSWAQFDNIMIYSGLTITFAGSLLILYILFLVNNYNLYLTSINSFRALFFGIITALLSTRFLKFFSILFGSVFNNSQLLKIAISAQSNLKVRLATSALLSLLYFVVFSITSTNTNSNLTPKKEKNVPVSIHRSSKSPNFSFTIRLIAFIAIVFIIFHSLIFTSNSFTINEDNVVFYLLQTFLFILLLISAYHYNDFKIAGMQMHQIYRPLVYISLVLVLNKVASVSTVCREETSIFCNPTFYGFGQSPSLTVSTVSLSLFNIAIAYFCPILLRKLVFSNSSSSRNVFDSNVWISFGLGTSLLMSSFYWFIDSIESYLSDSSFSNPLNPQSHGLKIDFSFNGFANWLIIWFGMVDKNTLGLMKLYLPRISLLLTIVLGCLCVYLIQISLANNNLNFSNVSKTNTLKTHNSTQKSSLIGNKIRQRSSATTHSNFDDNVNISVTDTYQNNISSSNDSENNRFKLYMMAITIIYSICCTFSPPMGSINLTILVFCLVLVTKSINSLFSSINTISNSENSTFIEICKLLVTTFLFVELSYLHYFSTGHQFTIPSIQWSVGFVGLKSMSFLFSGTSIFLNTFASPILAASVLPATLIYKPKVQFYPKTEQTNPAGFNSIDHDLHTSPIFSTSHSLNNNTSKSSNTLKITVSCIFLLFHLFLTLMAMVFANFFKRHLMVWKIFCPRFIFAILVFAFNFLAIALSNLF